ncbi:MAG TPA: hypothetical protein VLA83_02715 [Candidatus Binatia bacterium]|nr:hypothetical protein [Candidatus Binatia bacterium]
MNAASACERGGSCPVADAGNLLLGLPGAPGWTTTGAAGAVCARAAKQEKAAIALAAENKPTPQNTARTRLREKQFNHLFRIFLNILWSEARREILTLSKVFSGQSGLRLIPHTFTVSQSILARALSI